MKSKRPPADEGLGSFRPNSYWEDSDPLAAILRNVKGANRRKMITDYWNAGRIEELDPDLLADETDPGLRQFLERLHPSFMGGEYLPDLLPEEVEIARISLQSTTFDVISIRARREPGAGGHAVETKWHACDTPGAGRATAWPLTPPSGREPGNSTSRVADPT